MNSTHHMSVDIHGRLSALLNLLLLLCGSTDQKTWRTSSNEIWIRSLCIQISHLALVAFPRSHIDGLLSYRRVCSVCIITRIVVVVVAAGLKNFCVLSAGIARGSNVYRTVVVAVAALVFIYRTGRWWRRGFRTAVLGSFRGRCLSRLWGIDTVLFDAQTLI